MRDPNLACAPEVDPLCVWVCVCVCICLYTCVCVCEHFFLYRGAVKPVSTHCTQMALCSFLLIDTNDVGLHIYRTKLLPEEISQTQTGAVAVAGHGEFEPP